MEPLIAGIGLVVFAWILAAAVSGKSSGSGCQMIIVSGISLLGGIYCLVRFIHWCSETPIQWGN
jgi:hypothetical protein